MSIFHKYLYLPEGKDQLHENLVEEKSIINKALFSFFGIHPKGRDYYDAEGCMFRTTYRFQLWWALFGETKILYWFFWGQILFFVGLLYIAIHFILKYW